MKTKVGAELILRGRDIRVTLISQAMVEDSGGTEQEYLLPFRSTTENDTRDLVEEERTMNTSIKEIDSTGIAELVGGSELQMNAQQLPGKQRL